MDGLRLGAAPRRGAHRPKTLFSFVERTLRFVAEDSVEECRSGAGQNRKPRFVAEDSVEERGGVAFDLPLLDVFLGFVPCARCRLRVGDGEAGVHRLRFFRLPPLCHCPSFVGLALCGQFVECVRRSCFVCPFQVPFHPPALVGKVAVRTPRLAVCATTRWQRPLPLHLHAVLTSSALIPASAILKRCSEETEEETAHPAYFFLWGVLKIRWSRFLDF